MIGIKTALPTFTQDTAFSLMMVLIEDIDENELVPKKVNIFCDADENVRKLFPGLSKGHDDDDDVDTNDADVDTSDEGTCDHGRLGSAELGCLWYHQNH